MSEKPEQYTVSGRTFTWTTEDGEAVEIPLRIKLKVIRSVADRELDAAAMFDLLEQIIPGQTDVLDEMDIHDFESMFSAWQREYQARSGATLGE